MYVRRRQCLVQLLLKMLMQIKTVTHICQRVRAYACRCSRSTSSSTIAYVSVCGTLCVLKEASKQHKCVAYSFIRVPCQKADLPEPLRSFTPTPINASHTVAVPAAPCIIIAACMYMQDLAAARCARCHTVSRDHINVPPTVDSTYICRQPLKIYQKCETQLGRHWVCAGASQLQPNDEASGVILDVVLVFWTLFSHINEAVTGDKCSVVPILKKSQNAFPDVVFVISVG